MSRWAIWTHEFSFHSNCCCWTDLAYEKLFLCIEEATLIMFARILQIFVVNIICHLDHYQTLYTYYMTVEREGQAIPDLSYIVYGACKWKFY